VKKAGDAISLNKHKPKIRVCFISPKVYPIFNRSMSHVFGGAEVDLYMLSTELAKDDHFSVSVIAGDYGQDDIETIENVSIYKSLIFSKNPIKGAYKIWQAMKKVDGDIYMIKTPSLGVMLLNQFCKRFKKKWVYRIAHDREFDGCYASKHPLMNKIFLSSLGNASWILSQKQSYLSVVSKKVNVNVKVDAIPNGHRIPSSVSVKKEGVLWVGRSSMIKRPDIYFKLAQAYSEIPFTMICPKAFGDTNYDQLKQKASEIKNISFIEHVSFHKIETYFSEAKVFVNTSDSEGFPNTFIQSTKCQTAILSLGVNPDNFLDNHKCGLCSNGHWDQFIKDFKIIYNNYEAYGQHGYDYASTMHDIQKIIEQYKSQFKLIVAR
jgi:glycosyltransferase involved in cell wall biosynthesis